MGNAITQDTRAIWLTLRDTGSWWSVKAMTSRWSPSYSPYEVQDALEALRAAGFAERRSWENRDAEYCFTSSCKPLPELPRLRLPGALT